MGNSLHCNRSPPKSATCGNIDVLLHQLPPLLLSRPQPAAAAPPVLAQSPTAAASRAAPTACGRWPGWAEEQGHFWAQPEGALVWRHSPAVQHNAMRSKRTCSSISLLPASLSACPQGSQPVWPCSQRCLPQHLPSVLEQRHVGQGAAAAAMAFELIERYLPGQPPHLPGREASHSRSADRYGR